MTLVMRFNDFVFLKLLNPAAWLGNRDSRLPQLTVSEARELRQKVSAANAEIADRLSQIAQTEDFGVGYASLRQGKLYAFTKDSSLLVIVDAQSWIVAHGGAGRAIRHFFEWAWRNAQGGK